MARLFKVTQALSQNHSFQKQTIQALRSTETKLVVPLISVPSVSVWSIFLCSSDWLFDF